MLIRLLLITLLLVLACGMKITNYGNTGYRDILKVTQNPVIGILTQPLEDDDKYQPSNWTQITSTYIKYVESVGGLVVPVHYTSSFEEIDELMGRVNGILFTGGDLNLTDSQTGEFDQYSELSNYIYQRAIEMNENGIHFPLWGTCQGHQLMMLLESDDRFLIKSSPRVYLPDSLNFNFLDQKQTRLYHDFSDEMIFNLETTPASYNIHFFGIHLSDFEANPNLSANYTVLSTNIDDDGVEYISSTEHKKYPFYTVQYHPERNLFKYNKANIPHSELARDLTTSLAEFYVNEAKKNPNVYGTFEETISSMIETVAFDDVDPDEENEVYYFKFA